MRLTESLNQFSPEAFNTLISLLPGGSDGKEAACDAEDLGSIPGLGRPPGERKATHSMLAWRIPWIEKTGGLQFMGSQRIRHDRVTNTTLSP